MAEDQSRIRNILAEIAKDDEEKPGLLKRILMGVPQAISVGFSKDPAAALGKQIEDMVKQQQIDKQRRQRLKELGGTLEIEDILAKGKENRELANRKNLAAYESDIRNDEFKVTSAENREQLRMKLEFDKSLEGIRFTNNKEAAQMQIDANANLEKIKNGNDIARMKMATQMQQVVNVLPYLRAGEASDMFSRVLEDGKITKQDIDLIQGAAKRGEREEFRQKYEIAVGPAREQAKIMMMKNTQAEVIEAIRKKSFDEEWMWVTGANGRQLFKYRIDPMTQSVIVPPGYKFEAKADAVDVFKHFTPLIEAFKGTGSLSTLDQGDGQEKAQRIDKLFESLPSSMTDDDKIKQLNDPRTQASIPGITPGDIEEAKARLRAKAPTDDPTELAIREIDEEVSRINPNYGKFGYGSVNAAPVDITPENAKLMAKLLDERYSLVKKRKDEAQVKYLQSELAQREADLAAAKTEVKKARLKAEIDAPRTGLRDRLKYAQSQVGK